VYSTIFKEIEKSSKSSAIYVGADSRIAGGITLFAVVVILHIESSKGGMCFAKKIKEDRRMPIAERLMKEVDLAVECASQLQGVVGKRKFEVHVDFNGDAQHISNKYVTYANGYLTSMGFKFRIKPNAFAASTAADHLLH
jgi:hypothetical protein